VHFFPEKLTFLVVASKTRSKTTTLSFPNLYDTAKNIILLRLWVYLLCWGLHLNFPYELGLDIFSPPWGYRCTHCTPGYAYAGTSRDTIQVCELLFVEIGKAVTATP